MTADKLTYADFARVIGTGLISAGIGLLIFVGITVTWGDPVTGFENARDQKAFAQQFHALVFKTDHGDHNVGVSLDPRLTEAAARRYRRSLANGSVAGKLTIPKINLVKYVVNGAGPDDLVKGPGLYSEAGFPGTGGPVAIAGHRTTHGAPFLNVDKLKPGNSIILQMPYGTFTYRVTKTRIILPNDWSIIDPGADQPHDTKKCVGGTCEFLVMTACHPKYSASHRIAVFSHLVKVELPKASAKSRRAA